jgi:ethanolamine-phosphate cytidylyltransferase
LIVGVHSDATVNRIRGGKFPLFNLHERVLGVLGCRYVDDVLVDAPYQITPEMIATLGINKIVHGIGFEDLDYSNKTEERYQHAKAAGILHVVQSLSTYCLERVFERIRTNQETFQSRFDKKMKEESEHYSQKYSDTTSGAEGNKT